MKHERIKGFVVSLNASSCHLLRAPIRRGQGSRRFVESSLSKLL